MQDVIEALKIEDGVLAQIERVCGRQLHRLSVEHDVLQRMLQSMPEEEEESDLNKEISEDLVLGTSSEDEVAPVVPTKAAGARRKPAGGKKSVQTKEKKIKDNKGKDKRINNAKNSTSPVHKTKRKSRRKKP